MYPKISIKFSIALFLSVLMAAVSGCFDQTQAGVVSGELKTRHKVTLTFDGPNTSLLGLVGGVALDGSARTERLTHFADYPGYKATNPVVSDDGRFMAFHYGKKGDKAGVGRGIIVFDLEMYERMKRK